MGYDAQLKLVADVVEENPKVEGSWPHIPAEDRTVVKSLYDDFHPAMWRRRVGVEASPSVVLVATQSPL